MKQFILNLLSKIKRDQVQEKLAKNTTKDIGYDENGFYPLTPVFWVGTDYTLNVQSIKERLISTIYPNDRDIKILASYDDNEQPYQPISQQQLRDTWFHKLNGLYLEKDGHTRDLWVRNKGIVDYPQKMPWLSSSDYNQGFPTQLEPELEEVPKEYKHLIPYFDVIEITRIQIVEKELLLESIRPFRFVKDLRVPIFTETDRFIKIYYKYVDIGEAQERYDEKQCQLKLETAFDNLIEDNK